MITSKMYLIVLDWYYVDNEISIHVGNAKTALHS